MELYNLEAEQVVLGTLIYKDDYLMRLEFLDEKHFYFEENRIIFKKIIEIIAAGGKVNSVILRPFFINNQIINKLGGASYLSTLLQVSTAIIDVRDYGLAMVELWQKRQLELILEDVKSNLGEDFNQIRDKINLKIEEIGFETTKEAKTIDNLVFEIIDNPKAELLEFGFPNLDELIGGASLGDLVILGGLPSSGKTTLCLNLARNMSEKYGVLFFSIEVKGLSIARKFLSEAASINPFRLKQGNLTQGEIQAANLYKTTPNKYKLMIDDDSGMTISKMRAKIKRMKKKMDLKMVCIDYLQLIQSEGKDFSREQQISKISEGLKKIAKDFNIIVIALSQLSRSVHGRENKRPILSDLRDSGGIEQNADIVMFVHRDQYFLEREKEPETSKYYKEWLQLYEASKNKADLIVAKYRDGQVGDVRFYFEPIYSRFTPLNN